MTKVCKECNIEQKLTEFYKDAKTPGGHRHNCKTCKNKKTLLWRDKNRARYNEIARQNNHKRYKKDRLRRYGITKDEHDAVREQQNGMCAICGKYNTSKKRDFATDHNHKTGKFRGLLCYKCNRDMHVVDDPIQLAKCIAYRDNN